MTNTETHAQNLKGIALILSGAILLSVMDGVMKHLFMNGHWVMQTLAIRSWFIVPVMLFWAIWKLPKGALKTSRPGLHFIRVVCGFFAPYCFFNAISFMPLADATVILFGSTFIMTALSVLILKEQVGIHRWAAVLIGFTGVVIAAKPSGDLLSHGAIYAMLGSFAYATLVLITRSMGPGEGAFKQVLYFHVWMLIATNTLALPHFVPIAKIDLIWIALSGLISIFGHLCLTRAFSIAPVGAVAPFEYTTIIWASLIGYVFWHDIPTTQTVLGAVIIVSSGLYLLHREQKLKNMKIGVGMMGAEASPVPIAGILLDQDQESP